MEIAKQEGALLSFDPNLRLRLWDSPKVAQALIMRVWKESNIIKVSDAEVEFLTNKDAVEDDAVMNLWHPELKLLLVTLGGKGCKYYTKIVLGILIGVKFGTSGVANLSKTYAIFVVVFLCVYVTGFAWSWGPMGWLIPSEIFPLEIRSAGQSINVSMNMFWTFVIAQVFLPMLCHLKFGVFFFFAGWMFIMTTFVVLFVPETKNVPIEEMILVWKKHPFWGKFIADEDIHVGDVEMPRDGRPSN